MLKLNLLNDKQKQAVTSTNPKIYVVAGAGCGKTRVLTYRIAYLLNKGVSEKNIYAFTFTNKAANEMKYRLNEILQKESNVYLSTFHSYCLDILRGLAEYLGYEKYFTIIDDDDKKKIIRQILTNQQNPLNDLKAIKAISDIKNLTKLKNKTLKERILILKVYYEYQGLLLKSNRMDFDDLLFQFYNLLHEVKDFTEILQDEMQYILVDECQDINNIQYQIILKLSEQHKNIFMVGDEDQCIYSFRGSDINCIKDFIKNQKAEVIKLEQNYRSTPNILQAANSVIIKNKKRIEKNLFTNYQDKNFKIQVVNLSSDIEEAIYIADLIEALINKGYIYKDFTILYRNNNISIPIEKELIKRRIPYYIIGKLPFFRRKEIKLLINYLIFLTNNNDDYALQEIINTPSRQIGESLLNTIKQTSEINSISNYEAIKLLIKDTNKEPLINFHILINQLTTEIKTFDIGEFLRQLIKQLDYLNILRKDINSKTKINNVFTFIKLLEELETTNQTIIDVINALYLENTKEEKVDNYVKLMTIHQAKGLEYKIVIVAGCNDGIIPSNKITLDILEEERRLFYVAITRAKERLYLLSGRRRLINGEYKDYTISPYILDIEKNTVNFN